MVTAGIVCEYNPFHNGHLYLIEQTRKNGATHIVCVMSGNFVQRGEAACLPKEIRARAAVENGADLVVELPLAWAVGSAQTFALGAVGILGAMGCVDKLSFGSESGCIEEIYNCVNLIEKEEVQCKIASLISDGLSYPAAVCEAVREFGGEKTATVLNGANDTLAVEYLTAIRRLSLNIEPLAVKRTTEHDGGLSAMAIREKLKNGEAFDNLVPENSYNLIMKLMETGEAPCSITYAERAVIASLRQMTKEQISLAPDVTGGLENRIFEAVRQADSLAGLYDAIKSKSCTHARIRRIILCLFLGIVKSDSAGTPPYIRVLAASKAGLEILSKIKNAATLPIVTRYSQVPQLDERGQRTFDLESLGGDLYGVCAKKIRPCGTDMRFKFISTGNTNQDIK